MRLFNTRLKMRKPAFIYKVTEFESACHQSLFIPVAFDAAWVLGTLAAPNHRVDLCSGASFACRRRASSIPLGICSGTFRPFRPACIFKFRGFRPSA